MAGLVTFSLDTREVERELAELGKRAPRIAVASLNRTAGKVRTFLKREIAKDTGLKQGDVNKQMSIRKASAGDPRAVVVITGKGTPLIQMGARGPEPSRGKGSGVTYRFGGQTRRVPSAFIATMPRSGHRGVFKREPWSKHKRTPPRHDLPIRQLFGPSVVTIAKRHMDKARTNAQAWLVAEIQRLLGRKDLAGIESGIGGGE